VTVGPFYDKTDGVTIETALTITNEKITLTADTDAGSAPTNILDNVTGATSGTANDLNYITGNDAGLMQLELAAADVNRVGRMFLSITDAANHVPVFHEFFVLPQAIYDWLTGVIVPLPANVTQLLGTAWLTPGTAGTPDVNAKLLGGTAQTGRDIGASVLLSSGAGAGQLDFTSGVVKSNLAQILGTALTETAGLIAAGFKKFFNVATPTGTVNSLPDAVPSASNGLPLVSDISTDTDVATAVGVELADDLAPTYQAKAWLFDDNGGTTDRYVVTWFKNAQPHFTSITSPTIQVIKVADASDLIASTAMTQIGTTGMFRFDEGTNRIVNGVAYVLKVTATIDAATRTWVQPIGRDS
jgi:hypothetical protein